MIRVIEGKEHQQYIYLVCALMEIPPTHNIDFYITKEVKDSIILNKNRVTTIILPESKGIKADIIYMLQKHRFMMSVNRQNKSAILLNVIDCYLANYYSLTLFNDCFCNVDNAEFKKILNESNTEFANCCYETVFEDYENEDSADKLLGKHLASKQYLRRCGVDFKSSPLEECFKDLNWKNVNQKYYEIEKILENYN